MLPRFAGPTFVTYFQRNESQQTPSDLPCQFRSEPLVYDYLEKQVVNSYPSPFRLIPSVHVYFELVVASGSRRKQKPVIQA